MRFVRSFGKSFARAAFACIVILPNASLGGARPQGATNAISLGAVTDRTNALYRCGERAEFTVTVAGLANLVGTGRAERINIHLSLDGGKTIADMELPAKDSITVTNTLDEPGFLRCDAVYNAAGKKYRACAAAGFEPERIKSAAVMPDDLDSFWNDGIRKLGKMPLDAKMESIPEYSDDGAQSFKISLQNVDGSRIYAYLGIPAKRPPPFPVHVLIPGAGVGPKSAQWVKDWAGKGAIALNVAVHSFDIGLPRGEIDQKYGHFCLPETYAGVTNREAYIFRRSILGIDRLIKYAAARPDFDGRHIVVSGSSQGGGLALIMAGLNPAITACAVNVPALSDHGGYLLGRAPGWPCFVPEGNPDRAAYLECSRYYDAANFARKIKCPVIASAGFIDPVCHPGSVYAAYNEIGASKRMFTGPLQGHETIKSFSEFSDAWIMEQLDLGKK